MSPVTAVYNLRLSTFTAAKYILNNKFFYFIVGILWFLLFVAPRYFFSRMVLWWTFLTMKNLYYIPLVRFLFFFIHDPELQRNLVIISYKLPTTDILELNAWLYSNLLHLIHQYACYIANSWLDKRPVRMLRNSKLEALETRVYYCSTRYNNSHQRQPSSTSHGCDIMSSLLSIEQTPSQQC